MYSYIVYCLFKGHKSTIKTGKNLNLFYKKVAWPYHEAMSGADGENFAPFYTIEFDETMVHLDETGSDAVVVGTDEFTHRPDAEKARIVEERIAQARRQIAEIEKDFWEFINSERLINPPAEGDWHPNPTDQTFEKDCGGYRWTVHLGNSPDTQND